MKRLLICLAALLLTLPAAFAQETVYSGIDTWSTPATGATFTDFARHPIPAGFFCAGSKAFAGKVALRGVPIVTGRLGELGMTDTIVERLDDATFNESGMAITRLQMRSLSLESIAPIRTAGVGLASCCSSGGGEVMVTLWRAPARIDDRFSWLKASCDVGWRRSKRICRRAPTPHSPTSFASPNRSSALANAFSAGSPTRRWRCSPLC